MVVESDVESNNQLSDLLLSQGFAVIKAAAVSHALRIMKQMKFDIILFRRCGWRIDYFRLLKEFTTESYSVDCPCVIVSPEKNGHFVPECYIYWLKDSTDEPDLLKTLENVQHYVKRSNPTIFVSNSLNIKGDQLDQFGSLYGCEVLFDGDSTATLTVKAPDILIIDWETIGYRLPAFNFTLSKELELPVVILVGVATDLEYLQLYFERDVDDYDHFFVEFLNQFASSMCS